MDIFAAGEGGVEIVEENLDECVLCGLCLDASPPGTVQGDQALRRRRRAGAGGLTNPDVTPERFRRGIAGSFPGKPRHRGGAHRGRRGGGPPRGGRAPPPPRRLRARGVWVAFADTVAAWGTSATSRTATTSPRRAEGERFGRGRRVLRHARTWADRLGGGMKEGGIAEASGTSDRGGDRGRRGRGRSRWLPYRRRLGGVRRHRRRLGHLPPPRAGKDFTTAELKANVFAAGRVGDVLTAIGRPLHVGRRTQVWEVRILKEAQERRLLHLHAADPRPGRASQLLRKRPAGS